MTTCRKSNIITPDENFYRNNITFTSVPDITAITEPLKKIGLGYFTFDRTYKDGSHIRLTNAGKWIESYYRKKLYDVAIFERDPKLFSDGYVFWAWLKREPVYSAAHEHNIAHGLTITQSHDLYCDFFHFGTTCDNFISPEILVTRLNNLYRFIALFKEKARQTIIAAEATRFILPITALQHIKLADIKHKDQLNIFKMTDISRLYLGDELDNVYLTRREIEILGLLTSGKKPVDISKQFELSERTMETHIKNIKTKFKCNTLFELGFITGKLGIQNAFPFAIDLNDDTGEKDGIVA